ncbi:MAG: recombination mediator RecR, partial [Planctomycetota bacterium]
IEKLRALPGIGPKTAERLAHDLVRRPEEEVGALADAMVRAAAQLRPCSRCARVAETDPCPVCADPERDRALVCVVETSRDLETLEASREFSGVYHVLGGRVAPAEGVGLDDLNVRPLLERVRRGEVREVILATNATFEGEATAAMLARALGHSDVRLTRIARGIPTGGEIVHMNAAILGEALRGRAELHVQPGEERRD